MKNGETGAVSPEASDKKLSPDKNSGGRPLPPEIIPSPYMRRIDRLHIQKPVITRDHPDFRTVNAAQQTVGQDRIWRTHRNHPALFHQSYTITKCRSQI